MFSKASIQQCEFERMTAGRQERLGKSVNGFFAYNFNLVHILTL